MVVRTPHIIKFNLIEQGEAYQNADGDWIQPETQQVEVVQECRMQPQGEGKTFKNQDGDDVEYSMFVYMPKGSIKPQENVDVAVLDNGIRIGSGQVKRVHESQLNVKIWL